MQSPHSFASKAGQLISCAAVLTLALACSSMALAEAPIYDVEVIIFSNQNSGDSGEHWPTSIRDMPAAQDFVAEGQISEQPGSSYRLDGIAYALKQSRGYTVLLHTAWRQPAYNSRKAIGYSVDASVGNGNRRLSGRIDLVRERYLHLDVDLFLSPAYATLSASEEDAAGPPVYELRERRRIKKSGTVHYFDHPRLGMIATVTPYQSPQMQQQLQQEEMEAAAAEEANSADDEPLPDDDQLTR